MTSESDIREVEDGKVRRKRRITQADWAQMAEFVSDEYVRRKEREQRKDHEKQWKEIDRQVEMKPDLRFKTNAQTQRIIPEKAWMPEVELPRQAQTLEVLTADVMRLLLPDTGPWFRAHVEMTDDYLRAVEGGAAKIAGDDTDAPSLIVQDNANKLVEGALNHNHRQYDFRGHLNLIQAEAIKYGMAVGRGVMVDKRQFIHEARGTYSDQRKFPCLVPRSIKKTYPDDNTWTTLNEGHDLGRSMIFAERRPLADVVLAANKGSNDPDDPSGGWMPQNLKNLEPFGDDNAVDFLEFEGDMVVSRKTTRALVLPGVIVTVVRGQVGGEPSSRVVRLRYRKMPFSSYVLFPYHQEDVEQTYSPSPLMKGRPLQISAVEALLRTMQAAAYNAEPAAQYDASDPNYSLSGPTLHPGAMLPSISEIKTIDIGDPSALFQVFTGLLAEYDNVTGVNQPRLGAQTRSHTTAFAKDAELTRGSARTVDYANSALAGPLTQWIGMEYAMTRRNWVKDSIYLDTYDGFVEIEQQALSENVAFEVFGSGGPSEQQIRMERKLASVQQALQVDQLNIQLGEQPHLDLKAIQDQILREGGWTDVESITRTERASTGVPEVATGGPDLAGDRQQGGAGAAIAALQDLSAA